ncbi:hypothetical protein LguiA_035513 [Lonicera macranthoides]
MSFWILLALGRLGPKLTGRKKIEIDSLYHMNNSFFSNFLAYTMPECKAIYIYAENWCA